MLPTIVPPPKGGIMWRVVPVALVSIAMMAAFGTIQAMAMQVMDSKPTAAAVMDGDETEFFVRFDEPVNHAASRLVVVQDGKVVQTLHPRLESEPNVLYSGVHRLASGTYTLRWTTESMQGHAASQGEIPFTVR
jgi:methionine-rich copper-binding protein CopC